MTDIATDTPAFQVSAVAAELQAMREAREKAEARTAAALAAQAAATDDPAVALAEEKIAFARAKREADAAEHELACDAVYREACLKHGDDRVMRVRTRYGSIVLRAQTELEGDAAEARSGAFVAPQNASAAEKMKAQNDRSAALQLGLQGTVLSDLEHFKRVTTDNWMLWKVLWAARNTLVDARETGEGKGGAH